MSRKQRRLGLIGGLFAIVAVSVGLILFALKDNIVFFNSPSDLAIKPVAAGKNFRLGGLVETGTLERLDGQKIRFRVTDGNAIINVSYTGLLPDLFREGQGVIAEGALDAAGLFIARNILAKHDETYMPKEVADALKKQGHWKEPGGSTGQDTNKGSINKGTNL